MPSGTSKDARPTREQTDHGKAKQRALFELLVYRDGLITAHSIGFNVVNLTNIIHQSMGALYRNGDAVLPCAHSYNYHTPFWPYT
jgi:hypothetical protein